VRPAAPPPTNAVLLCFPWATQAAYTGSPASNQRHQSLYDSADWDRLRKVSLERPLDHISISLVDGRIDTVAYPFFVYKLLVDNGFHVDACTSFDLHSDPTLLNGYQLFISAGHDEYWSKEMRDRVESFVASGKNAAFFSANVCWWQVRFEDPSPEYPGGKTMVCFKSAAEDPKAAADGVHATGNFSSAPTTRPENSLTGVSFRRGGVPNGSVFVVKRTGTSPYDFFRNTNPPLRVGSTFGANTVDAGEVDGAALPDPPADPPVPTTLDGTPSTFVILATADTRTGTPGGWATLGYYTNVGTVFTAASIRWARMLDPSNRDPNNPVQADQIATITKNVVSTLSSSLINSAITFPSPTPVPTDWQHVPTDATGGMVAIAGSFSGHLFLIAFAQSFLLRRDPEVLTSAQVFSTTRIPTSTLSDATAMTTDYYSKNLYVRKASVIQRHSTDPTDGSDWETLF
jgi:N,N-dimethylformamidase beta subunit-like protein